MRFHITFFLVCVHAIIYVCVANNVVDTQPMSSESSFIESNTVSQNATSNFNKGKYYYEENNLKMAIIHFKAAQLSKTMQEDPNLLNQRIETYSYLSLIYTKLNMFPEAYEQIQTGMDVSRNNKKEANHDYYIDFSDKTDYFVFQTERI